MVSFSPGSSVTGTATYKITDADINTGYVANVASATGPFNGQTITSPGNIVTVRYKHPTNGRSDNGGYDGVVVPVVPAPVPMMSSSPMYGSALDNGPSSILEAPNSDYQDSTAKVSSYGGSKARLIGSKSKASISKQKHKKHSKNHKVEKKSFKTAKLK